LRFWSSNLFVKIRYEWGRVFSVAAIGSVLIALFYVIDSVRGPSPGWKRLSLSIAVKASLALAFPLVLFALKFFDERELRKIGELWQRLPSVPGRGRVSESV